MIYGKLIHAVKYLQAAAARLSASNETLYNGVAVTAAAGTGIDSRGYDEINIVLNAGTFEGAANLAASVVESDTDDSTAATAVTSASFTAITTANDEAIHTASIRCMGTKRYLWLKTVQTGSATSRYSALAILGKEDVAPSDNSPVFDLL